jgi:hypothetical protein
LNLGLKTKKVVSKKQVQTIREPREEVTIYERKIQKPTSSTQHPSNKSNEIQKKVIKTVVRRETKSSAPAPKKKVNPILKMIGDTKGKYKIQEEKTIKEKTKKVQQIPQKLSTRPLIHIPAPQKKINLQRDSSPPNSRIPPPSPIDPNKVLFFEKPKMSGAMKKISNQVNRNQVSEKQIQNITRQQPPKKVETRKEPTTTNAYSGIKIPKKKK